MAFSERAKKRARRLYSLFFRFCGVCFALSALACCAGCAESNSRTNTLQAYEGLDLVATSWFYFDSSGNLVKADNPSAIPSPGFRPWTEAPAVMDAGIAGSSAVLLVNKKGVLSAETLIVQAEGGETPSSAGFAVPEGIFPSADALSAGTLARFAFEEGKAFARFYRSVVFDSDRSAQPVALFLCGEAPYFPLEASVFASDFGAEEGAQFVSLNYTEPEPWVAAFKTQSGIAGGVSFEYFALSALPGSPDFSARSISAAEFQELSESAASEAPPQAFAAMLGLLPDSSRVSIQIAGEGFPESRTFSVGETGESLAAWGFINDGGAAVLFSDGTFYFSSGEEDAAVKYLRFPRLNSGYVYTAFVFSEEGILAGWEERRFYETGRSGIIAVSVPAGFFD